MFYPFFHRCPRPLRCAAVVAALALISHFVMGGDSSSAAAPQGAECAACIAYAPFADDPLLYTKSVRGGTAPIPSGTSTPPLVSPSRKGTRP